MDKELVRMYLPCGGEMVVTARETIGSGLPPYGYWVELVNVPVDLKRFTLLENGPDEEGTVAVSGHWSTFVNGRNLKTLRELIDRELERRGEK